MPAFRSVVADPSVSREKFLYELKVGPVGGLRPPSGSDSTVTGAPASPSA